MYGQNLLGIYIFNMCFLCALKIILYPNYLLSMKLFKNIVVVLIKE